MPKPPLHGNQSVLEQEIIETMVAGLKLWRSDLNYPESHSDMQACARGLLVGFEIKRNPLPKPLQLVCDSCEGIGHLVTKVQEHCRELQECTECKGRGYKLSNP